MNVQTEIKTANNGVSVDALLGARAALTEAPAAAQFTWRADCSWIGGVHSRSTVKGFFGLGEEQAHSREFAIDADHPPQFAASDNGATPPELILSALASCLTAGIASVAQHRGIQLHSVTSKIEGDMDIAGILGIDSDIRNGFSAIRVMFDIDADATADEIAAVFGMRLDGEDAPAIGQRGVAAEVRLADDLGLGRKLRHLVLVPGVERQLLALDAVDLAADGPAAGMLGDLAAERLRDDLVPEADADQRHARGMDLADERLERRNPGVVLVGAVFRAGDQPAIAFERIFRDRPALHVVGDEVETPSGQEPCEHFIVIAHLLQGWRDMAGLQYADFHGSPLVGARTLEEPAGTGKGAGRPQPAGRRGSQPIAATECSSETG